VTATIEKMSPEPVPLVCEWVDHGFVQAKEAQNDVLTVLDTCARIWTKAGTAATECHLRMIEMAQANAAASFALAGELMAAENLAQLITRATDGTRRQAETAAAQLHELSGLAGRMASETAEPISTNISRAFQQAA
jgi:hypothetical protein